MKMLEKILLYCRTVRYLKKEQLVYQVLVIMGFKCTLNNKLKYESKVTDIQLLTGNKELNYDEVFINRFNIDELMQNIITLLYETETLSLGKEWTFPNKSPLWNHNIHYFEYLFPLAKKYEETGDFVYVEKIKELITAWIDDNPMGTKNSSWACYPVALRLSNWIDIYSILYKEFSSDSNFNTFFLNSLYSQYVFLVKHLEKHLMANHYFEDLRSIIIGSVFFKDNDTCEMAKRELITQCKEQILDDGFQYERSPMYQKILTEDLIKVVNALQVKGEESVFFKKTIGQMLNVSYSLENSINRIPLFNDCGNNITKSLQSIVEAAKNMDIYPYRRNSFISSGFYIYDFGEREECRMIVDAGQPGPSYSPGHSHNECMSYELFISGKPIIVNCGTYAYQTKKRKMYKSALSHNTVRIAGFEQSEFWSSFRLARRATVSKIKYDKTSICMGINDYLNNQIERTIYIADDNITVVDRAPNKEIESFIHCMKNQSTDISIEEGNYSIEYISYAEEFGSEDKVKTYLIKGNGEIRYSIHIRG